MNDKRLSKLLSFVLRHRPEAIGLELNPQGWAPLDTLLAQLKAQGHAVNLTQIERVVANNDKQRFKLDLIHRRIRANQGHSIPVDLALDEQSPPPILYHGTAQRFLSSILEAGLLKRQRQHVHLSQQYETAIKVGQRHGKVVILLVKAQEMQAAGYRFFLAENGVWLTDWVPPHFLEVEKKASKRSN
ncbi:MAG: RNA 2'-phosphotransferase [Bacteroidota bacterium]